MDNNSKSYDLIAMGNKGRNYDDATVINGFVLNDKDELEHYIDREGVAKAVIPDGITKIPRHVFYECEFLKSLYIPKSVREFETNLMHCNNFEKFIVDDDHLYFTVKDGVLYNKDITVLVYCPNGYKAEKFVVPDGVISIEDDAFAGCINLIEIVLPESVDYIGYDAFCGCSSLKHIKMPKYMAEGMQENTFFGCSSLEEITFPDGIRYVGANDFDWCQSLKKITFGKTMQYPEDFALALPALEEIIVDPENPYFTAENGILYDKTKTILFVCAQGIKGEVVVPDTVTQIGYNMFMPGFKYCDNLTSIKLPQSVRHIYKDAFKKCSAKVFFPEPDKIDYFTAPEYLKSAEEEHKKYDFEMLTIHGYHGSPENATYRELDKTCVNITAPSIDFDSESPETVLNRLRFYIAANRINVIVGTSLGGFYAAVLSAEFNIPVILVNPCLMPFLHLPRLGYKGDITSYISMFGTLENLKNENICCIVGDADNVIDTHDLTERMCKNERFRRVPGGKHSAASLPLNEYFDEVLPYCNKLYYEELDRRYGHMWAKE